MARSKKSKPDPEQEALRVRGRRMKLKPLRGLSSQRVLLRDAEGKFPTDERGRPLTGGRLTKRELLARTVGCCRLVWNLGRAVVERALEERTGIPSAVDLVNRLPAWKTEFPFLAEPPSQVLQQVLRDLRSAYDRFLSKQGGRPRLKRKGDPVALRFPSPDQFSYDPRTGLLRLPKFGSVGLFGAEPLEGRILSCSLTVDACGDVFVSIQTRTDDPRTRAAFPAAVGVELGLDFGVAGITGQAVLSDGRILGPDPKAERRMAKKAAYIVKEQRRQAHRTKGSNNHAKGKKRIARAFRSIADIRLDACHKATAKLASETDFLAIEDVSSKALAERSSAEGRHELAAKLMASLWHPFRVQALYKFAEAGHSAVLVPCMYTSCSCVEPHCSNYLKSDPAWRTGNRFSCPACGHTENSETHAARTMLVLAKRRLLHPNEILGADAPRGQGRPKAARAPRPKLPPGSEGTLPPFAPSV